MSISSARIVGVGDGVVAGVGDGVAAGVGLVVGVAVAVVTAAVGVAVAGEELHDAASKANADQTSAVRSNGRPPDTGTRERVLGMSVARRVGTAPIR
jgi:hypothetical protein